MTDTYYTPILSLEEVAREMKVGDRLLGLPYKWVDQFASMIHKFHPNADYWYEGTNFILCSI